MAYKTLNGLSAKVLKAARGTLVTTGDLNANTWYEVNAVASSGSALPSGVSETSVFETPDASSTAITLGSGDEVYPLTLTQLCKTDLSLTAEEAVLDVTDDCGSGQTQKILDGFPDMKGTLGGFTKFDAVTGEMKDETEDIMGRYFDLMTDDGEGTYTFTAKSNDPILLMICLNKDAAVGEYQNWIIIPVILSSVTLGAGLKDAQKRDLSWEKGQGNASLYTRKVFAADVLG